MNLIERADALATHGKGVRRVRTPEGQRRFGQPIGSVIVPDVIPDADLPNFMVPHTFPVHADSLKQGDHIVHEGAVHAVESAIEVDDDVALALRRESNGERTDVRRSKKSIIAKIILTLAAFLSVAGIAFAGTGGGDAPEPDRNRDTSHSQVVQVDKVNPPLNEMKPRPAPETVAGYKKMFHKIDTDLWGAADVSISQELPDGRRVWLYGDTFSGKNGFQHSTGIVQDGGNLHVANDGKQLLPNSGTSTRDGKEYKNIYWIEQVDLLENGNLRIVSAPVQVGTENAWDFYRDPDRSRHAEVSVNEAGDMEFVRWLGYAPRPLLTGDGEDFTKIGENHYTYQKEVHDIQLSNGQWLVTTAQNWDDDFANHIDPKTGALDYDDFRPLWSSSTSRDSGYIPNPSLKESDVKALKERALRLVEQIEAKERRVRTPGGAAHYGQPIGSVIRRDPLDIARRVAGVVGDVVSDAASYSGRRKADKFKTVKQPVPGSPTKFTNPPQVKGSKHLWEMPESDYEGFELWTDSRNLKVYVAQDEDGWWYAEDSNSVILAEGKTRAQLVKELDPIVAPELKPGMHWATEAEKKKYVIPPNYRDVMIADDPTVYNYAVGFDYVAKPQWKYSTEYRGERDAIKFERMKKLQKKIPALDKFLKANVGDDNSDALMMMRVLGMRPDTGADTGEVETFGATSLQAKHVKVSDSGIVTLNFIPGKKKVPVTIKIKDKMLADMLRERLKNKSRNDLMFGDANAASTNKMMKSVVGQGFSNKDLRTLKANAIALELISKKKGAPKSKTEFNKWRREVAQQVSDVLGNTPTVALGSYINPIVFQSWAVDPSWL